ncbi:unnamed protein product [Periconia digitata]|uniref:SNF2 N-terminal domain-containing protein n=1 Tax=Periconia digitata TaxID=1303443 RepID=A0A9W4U9S0_9PLEO|nr:unnamed protein product [Periconia digitata]
MGMGKTLSMIALIASEKNPSLRKLESSGATRTMRGTGSTLVIVPSPSKSF